LRQFKFKLGATSWQFEFKRDPVSGRYATKDITDPDPWVKTHG